MKVTNFIKRKPWITVVAVILLTVLACGAIASFTDADFAFFSKPLNEDNLLYEEYDNWDKKTDAAGITYRNNDGVITASAGLFDSKLKEDTSFTFATVILPAGTYTYSCFEEKADAEKYFSYIVYNDNVVIGDLEDGDIEIEGKTVVSYKTFTITENTEVEFVICFKEGTKPINVKALPVLVAGNTAGNFYDK